MFEESRRSAHVPNLYFFFLPLKDSLFENPLKKCLDSNAKVQKREIYRFLPAPIPTRKKTIRLYTCTPFFFFNPLGEKKGIEGG